MSYSIRILRRGQKALARFPKQDYERVIEAIRGLAADPRPPGARKLRGRDGWRIRIGSNRVIYEIEDADKIVTVLDLGHRSNIYR